MLSLQSYLIKNIYISDQILYLPSKRVRKYQHTEISQYFVSRYRIRYSTVVYRFFFFFFSLTCEYSWLVHLCTAFKPPTAT